MASNQHETMMNMGHDNVVGIWDAGGNERHELIRAVGYANEGAMWRALVNMGWLTKTANGDGNAPSSPAKPRKPRTAGVLPARTERWILARLGLDPDDTLPEGFDNKSFWCMQDVDNESAAYLAHLAKLGTEEKESLAAWLGHALTAEERKREQLFAEREQERHLILSVTPKLIGQLDKLIDLVQPLGDRALNDYLWSAKNRAKDMRDSME